MFQQLEVKEKNRSNKARKSIINVSDKKSILTPVYGTSLQRQFEINLICSDKFDEFNNIGIISSKIYDAWNIIREKEGRLSMLNLKGEFVEKNYRNLRAEKLWIFDPCTDEVYYKNPNTEKKFKECGLLSQNIRKFLIKMDGKNYDNSWKSLNENIPLFMKFLREFVKAQAELKADIILPPVPMIMADSPDYIVDIWHKIIKTTGVLSKTLAEKNSSILINLNFNIFRRPTKLKKLLETLLEISSEDSISEIKTIIIKIQKSDDLEADTAETRTRFKKFIAGIIDYASLTKRATFILDESSIGLACISLGIDGFIEPLNGVTGVGIARSNEKKGRYYHPEGLKYVRFPDIKEFYNNNNKKLPCNCHFCSNINGNDLDSGVSIEEWNTFRRGHLLESRNSEIEEYNKTIDENTTTNAIIDKIQRSDIKNLLDILPK